MTIETKYPALIAAFSLMLISGCAYTSVQKPAATAEHLPKTSSFRLQADQEFKIEPNLLRCLRLYELLRWKQATDEQAFGAFEVDTSVSVGFTNMLRLRLVVVTRGDSLNVPDMLRNANDLVDTVLYSPSRLTGTIWCEVSDPLTVSYLATIPTVVRIESTPHAPFWKTQNRTY